VESSNNFLSFDNEFKKTCHRFNKFSGSLNNHTFMLKRKQFSFIYEYNGYDAISKGIENSLQPFAGEDNGTF